MTNLDMLQSSVGLEVEAGINAQHVTLESVDMGAEETVDECANRTDQETNSGHETESLAANSSTPEMQVEEVWYINYNFDVPWIIVKYWGPL